MYVHLLAAGVVFGLLDSSLIMDLTLGSLFSLTLLFHVSIADDYVQAPKEAVDVECRDRHLTVTTYLSFFGAEVQIHFEAIDPTGVYPITQQHGSECGYTYTMLPLLGRVVLRASYFSCHTDNTDDEVFTFKFNLITSDQHGETQSYTLSKTCSLGLPWSEREVTCEENYMEVSVKNVASCSYSGVTTSAEQIWDNAVSAIHRSSTLAWQVVFLQEGQLVEQMSVDEAHTLGYHLNFTLGRMVFRMPYGQPHSVVSVVNGLPLEVVHLVLFSRQLWEVLMVDMVAACNLYEGSFDGATLSWKMPTVVTPLVLGHSEFKTKQISLGVDGQLLDDQTTTSWGYIREVSAETVTIAVPYGAKGGHGKSFVLHNVYTEFYTVHLYYEQVFMDESGFETRLRLVRPMATPLLEHHPFTINQTVLEERKFTVFVGNFPTDVELVAVKLNRQDFTPLEADQHGYPIVKLSHSNSTHAYVISVPFEDSLVPKMYSFEGVLRYSLDITYTLNVMPQKDPYYHLASVVALINDVFPPMFSGLCMENGIRFKMDHQEFDYMWEVCIGQFPLTEQLSAERGYYMQNGSQSMILEVPLFSIGYIYEDITLQNFFGTFEILARDPKTMEIQQSSAKRCLFKTTEFVACSSDGIMTVVSDLTKAIPGANPARATLLDKTCRPKELDENRVLFTFGVNTCGTRVQVDGQFLSYENEIVVDEEFHPIQEPVITRDTTYRLTVRCVYAVEATHRLTVSRKFRAEAPGKGSSIKTKTPVKVTQVMKDSFSSKPPAPLKQLPNTKAPAIHKPAKFIRVFGRPAARG